MAEQPANAPLIEGVDYVIQDGRWVFSAACLLKRGACCGSDCRNCPYPKDPASAPKSKSCAKCGTPFPCNPGNCWCSSVTLSIESLQNLRKSFNDCLCPDCLTRKET